MMDAALLMVLVFARISKSFWIFRISSANKKKIEIIPVLYF